MLFASEASACSEAVAAAGEMFRDLSERYWTKPSWQMEVTDEEGAVVCELSITGRSRCHGEDESR